MSTVFVDDRVGRFRVNKRVKVLDLMAAGAEFGVATTACDAEVFVVSAYGDVDPVTAPELERELLETVRLGASRVVVDLTQTTFFDSSAIHALVRSAERLQASRIRLDIVCRTDNLKRLFEITGVDRDMQIHATIEQAIGPTPSNDPAPAPRPSTFQTVATGGYA